VGGLTNRRRAGLIPRVTHPERSTLRRLVAPITPETFLAEYYERRPLLVQRKDPSYFDELLTWDEIDRVLTTLHLSHPQINIVDAKRQVRAEDYVYPSGLIDVARLYQCFADGSTIVLSNLEGQVQQMADLCRSMEQEMCSRFQANIYVTPHQVTTGDAAQGLRTHYDSHDVFVLQVEGVKHWILYDTPIELPFRTQEFNPQKIQPGDKTMEFDLEPGDTLYLPRGVMHDASTGHGDSLHITVGVLHTSWTELMLEAIAKVSLNDPELRRSLPAGFALPDFDRTEARRTFRRHLEKILAAADFDAALDHFADDLVSTRHSLLRGQLDQVRRLADIGLDTLVGVRPNLLYRLRRTDEHVFVSCYGGHTRFPAHTADALVHALTHDEYRVRDLPGDLDDPGKVVLISRLVREGLVQIL
jgi:ribosomal protein L16 Arg81 hydroxylase